MIGRGPLRLSHVLAVSVLTTGLTLAGFLTRPMPAVAGNGTAIAASGEVSVSTSHVVTFDSDGSLTQHATSAATVGDFLHERGITAGVHDFVSPDADTPLSDRMTIEYRAAVPVTIVSAHDKLNVVSSAQDVGALLEEQGVTLSPADQVQPAIAEPVPANGIVRVTHVLTWNKTEHRSIAQQTIHRLDFAMQPGTSKVVSKGVPGLREVMVSFVQRDGGSVKSTVVDSRVIRKASPRVIAEGVGEYDAFTRMAAYGLQRTSYIAASEMHMIATAYTAGCSGCSGITAIGRPAGHGIVAVDPSVIPLGTRLYIPGYGLALAGDTGGAIRGNRIDLGFNSLRDAMLFGRREVVVYRIR